VPCRYATVESGPALRGTETFPVAIVGAGRLVPGGATSTVQYVTL
jgi:hypothetical protein